MVDGWMYCVCVVRANSCCTWQMWRDWPSSAWTDSVPWCVCVCVCVCVRSQDYLVCMCYQWCRCTPLCLPRRVMNDLFCFSPAAAATSAYRPTALWIIHANMMRVTPVLISYRPVRVAAAVPHCVVLKRQLHHLQAVRKMYRLLLRHRLAYAHVLSLYI